MDRNKVLAHLGLALVTYVPLTLYILFVLIYQRAAAAEVFTSGVPEFLGFFATAVTMRGWPLVILSLVIGLRGLVKRDHARINGISLGFCLAWLAAGYWVMANFR